MITVTLVDSEGIEIPLPQALHKLRCENNTACLFPACGCGPLVHVGVQIKSPEEPRLKKREER